MLYGGRPAAQTWVELSARVLAERGAGVERCVGVPRISVQSSAGVVLEVEEGVGSCTMVLVANVVVCVTRNGTHAWGMMTRMYRSGGWCGVWGGIGVGYRGYVPMYGSWVPTLKCKIAQTSMKWWDVWWVTNDM